MTFPRQQRVQCLSSAGFHDMVYWEWGEADNPRVLVCVHGLTRCGRDFDFLGQALADHYRVICPDVVGRGGSAWLRDKRCYTIPQYCADMTVLLARIGARTVDWLGTSMGGLIGMALASQPETPIARLVLNDVGPVLSAAAVDRIGQFVGNAPQFPDLAAAEAYLRTVSASFGPLTDAQWHHLAVHAVRQNADGAFVMGYDPGIAEPFRDALPQSRDIDLWPVYRAIACPILILRGKESDLLQAATAQAMVERTPATRLVEFPGIGHAPMLLDSSQIGFVRDFLIG